MTMWGDDDAVSNGACSDRKPSPVNGSAEHDHNSMSSAATASCLMSPSSDSRPGHKVASKFANEKTASLKCVVCHSASTEASDISVSHGAASSPADHVAKPPTAASLNCHTVTRTSRYLYSDGVTDDGYFVNNTDCNAVPAPDVDTGYVCESVSSNSFSTNGVDLRSSCPQTSVDESVIANDRVNHNSERPVNDGRFLASEQVSVGAESSSGSSANTDLIETLTSVPANADLCDDGYMDEIDIASSSMVGEHPPCHTAAWFVETDTNLDDFIDADMPYNAAVTGSPSSSSLSSTNNEPTRMPEDDNSPDVIGMSESDVLNNSQQSLGYLQQSSQQDHRTVATSCRGLGDSDWLNGLHNQPPACTPLSHTQPSQSSRCLESDVAVSHTCRGANMQVQSSNPASESSHDTPPASLPSPSDDFYGNGEPVTAAFLAAVADEQMFEDNTSAGTSTKVRKTSNALETHDRPTGLKQNQSYWLPIGPESDLSPKFGCWSCVEVMNNTSLSLPAGHVTAGKPRLYDGRDSGVMWRSATEDYTGHGHSSLLTDDSAASRLQSRMYSSLTL